MAAADTSEPTPETTLAWERARRLPAGWAAVGAAVATLAGNVIISIALKDLPSGDNKVVTVTDALRHVTDGTAVPPGRLSTQAQYLGQHVTGPIAGAVLVALGALLMFVPLAYLYRAVRARREGLGQWLLILLAAGVVLYGVGNVVAQVVRDLGAQDFVNASDHTNSAATDYLTRSPSMAGQAMGQFGGLALAAGFILVSLNGMRLGLLPRFLGILGVIVGVTVVLPLDQVGIIRAFWLGALGVLILGRWPSGTPKAWVTGEAAPWPSRQELREQQQRKRGAAPDRRTAAAERRGRNGRAAESESDQQPVATTAAAAARPAAPRPQPRTDEPHSSSKKKRRKRRA